MVYHAETIATHLWHYVPIICNSHYATPENEWRIATFVAQNVNKGKIYTLFNIYSVLSFPIHMPFIANKLVY